MSYSTMPSDFVYRPINQEFSPMCSTMAMTITFPTPGINCITNSNMGLAWGNEFNRPTNWSNGVNYSLPDYYTQLYGGPSSWSNIIQPLVPWASQMTPNSSGIVTFEAPFAVSNVVSSAAGEYPNTSAKQFDDCEMRPRLLGKRKSVEPAPNAPSFKVRINEERMSACMDSLNLDNNNVDGARPDLEEEPWFSHLQNQPPETSLPVPRTENGKTSISSIKLNGESKLELCQELEMHLKTKQLLPKLILDELKKPCMQLVLWKPPGNAVLDAVNDAYKPRKTAEDCDSSRSNITATTEMDVSEDMRLSDQPARPEIFSQPAPIPNSCMSAWEIPQQEFYGFENNNVPTQDLFDDDMDL